MAKLPPVPNGFRRFRKRVNPLSEGQGAIVQMSDGSYRTIPPWLSHHEEFDWSSLWLNADIIAYKVIERKSDEIVRIFEKFVSFSDTHSGPLEGHAITQHLARSLISELLEAIRDYRQNWPDDLDWRGVSALADDE